MCEAFEVACKELGNDGHSEAPREVIARRIIAVAKLGDRDPVRLQAAALDRPD
jgi:hypothetical protein